MIDVEEVRSVFRQRVFNADIFGDAYQYENIILPTSDKGELWCAEKYINISEDYMSDKGDVLEGVFRYFISVKTGTNETACTNAVKELGNLFSTAEIITTDNYKTSIGTPRRNGQGNGLIDDSWYTIILDIDFKSYE